MTIYAYAFFKMFLKRSVEWVSNMSYRIGFLWGSVRLESVGFEFFGVRALPIIRKTIYSINRI